MKSLLCTIRVAFAAGLVWLLAVDPVIGQYVVHQGEITRLGVAELPFDSYTWDLYNDSTVNFATVSGTAVAEGDAEFVNGDTGPTVNVRWHQTGIYAAKVTCVDVSGCTNNIKIILISVLDALPAGSMAAGPPVCGGEPIALSVTLTGTAPWSFTYTDGTNEWTETAVMTETYVISIDPGPAATTEYWITRVTDNYGTNLEPSQRTRQQVNPSPGSPSAESLSECEEFPLQTLTAVATAPGSARVVWYDAPTGGTLVDSPTLSTVGSVSYYAESALGSCISPTRTEVVLTIEPLPVTPPISSAPQAQIPLPDKVCIGTVKTYWVDGLEGSVYTWKVNGEVQGSHTHEIAINWSVGGVYLLEVQEHQPNCDGAVQSGVVEVIGMTQVQDQDADGDGMLNIYEALPGVDWQIADTDADGFSNWLDIDADGDGIVDNVEAQHSTAYVLPSNLDVNSNGVDDAYDMSQSGSQIQPVDTDGDGIPDFLDPDSDNDGVPDFIEAHDGDANGKADRYAHGSDSDKDGLDDRYDTVPNDCHVTGNARGSNASMQDFDGDRIPDWRDDNDDQDAYLTRYEDLNGDGNWSNDDLDNDGCPEYLDRGRDCDLLIPDAFSPNGDGVHDYYQIYCINNYPDAIIYIFDLLGNKIYQKEHYGNLEVWKIYENAWWSGVPDRGRGYSRTERVAPGNYSYVLDLGNGEVKKGFVFVSYSDFRR